MDTIFDRDSLICLLEDAVPQVLEFFGDLIGRAAEHAHEHSEHSLSHSSWATNKRFVLAMVDERAGLQQARLGAGWVGVLVAHRSSSSAIMRCFSCVSDVNISHISPSTTSFTGKYDDR